MRLPQKGSDECRVIFVRLENTFEYDGAFDAGIEALLRQKNLSHAAHGKPAYNLVAKPRHLGSEFL
jgi:hypothetical protein